MQIHATAVQWQKKGLLFLGESGFGKSTAALLLMNRGAKLIADDQVILESKEDKCIATCPPTIKNKMEVRGVGIIDIKTLEKTNIDLVVFLKPDIKDIPRMPDPSTWSYKNIQIPAVTLCAFDCAFCERLQLILTTL